MDKKLVYVHGGEFFMFVDKSVKDVNEDTKCRVYNKPLKVMAPELSVGCWTCRMGPWREPTEKEKKEAEQWLGLK